MSAPLDEIMRAIIAKLNAEVAMEVRSAPDSGTAMEAVVTRPNLARCFAVLSEALGPPAKEFGTAAAFDKPTQRFVDGIGGIRKDQSLFLKVGDNQQVGYVALWPWASDATRITVKIGIGKIG